MIPRLKNSIDDLLRDGGEIVLTAYSFLENTEEVMHYILETTLQRYNRNELMDPVFSSLKELTTNAIKANIKKILAEEGKIEKPGDQASEVLAIRSILNEKSLLEYGIKCWERKLSIRIHISIQNNTLTIKVIDPQGLSEETKSRINQKIERAKDYENLAMCYLENPDPLAEGMGLGLSMVVVLLKGSGIDPDNFFVKTGNVKDKTCASLNIAL